ncbi:GNAT family N-acetyltransferase [Anaerocolumna sp. MB42-C2]|uniref:GNAT family N-acetyltransferase n=1 Tax=Anaerocolumna sp. MB42-C2 TaxID=3070997 RepID=UPI0027E21360|nr:GNAT family N-acetyltransferase [Anaerocolumna sp. MB42-C2]WMJ88566.1 GNAT family N-acetyltransferase [Anaerocolumna sp. MB42-C2]
MSISLRKMTSKEYDEFFEWSRNNHIRELIKDTNMSLEDALKQTEAEEQEMLPNGINTENNSLMVIENTANNRNIGFVWYLYEETDGVQQVFLCDFVIDESERRKGYATEALSEMERNATEFGCKESILFVAKENEPAQNLYAKSGYVFLREMDYGMYLKKKL